MANVEQDIKEIKSTLRRLEKLLAKEEKAPTWVGVGTILKKFELSRRQVEYLRTKRPEIARPSGNRYLYNLTEISAIAEPRTAA